MRLERGRNAFEEKAWTRAYAELSAADRMERLEPDDLERLATAAYLIGRDGDSAELWERAHHDLVARGEPVRAARCAFWLAFGLLNRGEQARGGGWLARAERLLDGRDCAERGYLVMTAARQCLIEGDHAEGYAMGGSAVEIGERFSDHDLVALARNLQGRALVRQDKVTEGLALLDEAMVAVTAGEVSVLVAGTVYCSVIEACHETYDLGRAREWTRALSRWCESQPGLVPYRGQCLVHRAEIMLLHGAWSDAAREVRQACEHFLRGDDDPAAGAAFYQEGELQRLCGRFAEAEESYRRACLRGREPQPGLALLRLAQGRLDAASRAIRRVLGEAHDRALRCRLLAAQVEIELAAGELEAGRAAADELSATAADLGVPYLGALAAHATGTVLLAEGDAQAALGELRRAWTCWGWLEVPYEAARTRALIATACHLLGDEDGARMERDAARWAFRRLGAAPDLAALDAKPPGALLTGRELQVLALVATGRSNRAIAAALFLSDKTVARHVSNILGKLGLPSRAAATAYAYEHGYTQ